MARVLSDEPDPTQTAPPEPIAIAWRRLDAPGHDAAVIRADSSGWRLEGAAGGSSRTTPTATTSGSSASIGQIVAAVGVVLVLVGVVVFPLAKRWALFRAKGRAVVFGFGILGRIIGAVLLLAVIVLGFYMLL